MIVKKVKALSWQVKYWLAVAVFFALLLSYLGTYYLGHQKGLVEFNPQASYVEQLEGELARLQNESTVSTERYDQLWAEFTRAKQQLQIDKSTHTELSRSLDQSTETITQLREQIDFYQNILAPVGDAAKLEIYDLSIRHAVGVNEYEYHLVLRQPPDSDKEVTGNVNLDVEGLIGNERKIVELEEAGAGIDKMQFRYFQAFQGEFALPVNFRPERIRVRVRPKDAKKPLEKWFPWRAV
ncbi:MAG: hypothetical protein OER96_12390 [Gammaproteobacteria bacterium]|nr:hypothetical protein [Gammaproteobacteria bacterium]